MRGRGKNVDEERLLLAEMRPLSGGIQHPELIRVAVYVQIQQDVKRAKGHSNQIYTQNLTETFGEMNTSIARDEVRSIQMSRQHKVTKTLQTKVELE